MAFTCQGSMIYILYGRSGCSNKLLAFCSSTGLVGGPLKNLSDPVSSNYRKIALRPLWAAMAGSPAPPTAGPRWRSERSRWPRAASCCLPAGRGVRRCLASPRRHRRGRSSNMAGALVGGYEPGGPHCSTRTSPGWPQRRPSRPRGRAQLTPCRH